MATKILTTVGLKCPRPLLEVHRVMKTLTAGEELEVVADDPAFRLDVQAWCRRTGHELVDLQAADERLVAMIRKA